MTTTTPDTFEVIEFEWATSKDGSKTADTSTRYLYYCQYGPESSCHGQWNWQVRSTFNRSRCASGIVASEDQARDMCEKTAMLSEFALIREAALQPLRELKQIGYEFPQQLDYDDGFKAGYRQALANMIAFIHAE